MTNLESNHSRDGRSALVVLRLAVIRLSLPATGHPTEERIDEYLAHSRASKLAADAKR
jgi:hypothetical protein